MNWSLSKIGYVIESRYYKDKPQKSRNLFNENFVGEDGDRSPGALSIDEKNKHENDSDISITDSSDERIGKNSNIWIPLI